MRPVATRLRVGILILSAYFDGVVALDHREMLLPIVGSIWTSNDRVALHPTHKTIGGVSP